MADEEKLLPLKRARRTSSPSSSSTQVGAAHDRNQPRQQQVVATKPTKQSHNRTQPGALDQQPQGEPTTKKPTATATTNSKPSSGKTGGVAHDPAPKKPKTTTTDKGSSTTSGTTDSRPKSSASTRKPISGGATVAKDKPNAAAATKAALLKKPASRAVASAATTTQKKPTESERLKVDLTKAKELAEERLNNLREKEGQLQTTLEQLKEAVEDLEQTRLSRDGFKKLSEERLSELTTLQEEYETAQKQLQEAMAQIEQHTNTITANEQLISELKNKLHESEEERKRIHNKWQEQIGSIRVYCRIRPELSDKELAQFQFEQDYREVIILEPSKDVTGSPTLKKHPFLFDKVFPKMTTQEEVFQEIAPLVQSVLDGYHCCIFAYGQTGSGKTFTMEGPPNVFSEEGAETLRGVIPRAMEYVFQYKNSKNLQGWTYEFEVSCMEIYLDEMHDLLALDKSAKLSILEKNQKVTITNLSTIKVSTPAEVYELISLSAKNRARAETLLNADSSRSHCIFQLRVRAVNNETMQKFNSVLNLVDLAGSERIEESGVTGQRLAEAKAINLSLSHLSQVILNISKNATATFRASKLTHVLREYLSAGSKVLMFVNISPMRSDTNHTINSLTFAKNVRECKLGPARRQVTESGQQPLTAAATTTTTTSSSSGSNKPTPGRRPAATGRGSLRPANTLSSSLTLRASSLSATTRL
ncbi:carboxy-terminal kinesin 2 [Pelomyxa schiedti]|nr:carboxy-terminal kinesin 2 [Pelomyxa schiedti]